MSGSMAHAGIPAAISGMTYNAANEPTQWSGATLSYDANGNLIGDATNTYTWNARNQLASVNSGVPVSFEYDAFGRRVGKSMGTTSTNYLYDGLNSVQELVNGSVSANMLTGGLDEIFARTDAIGPQNFLTDALGSTLELTDATGNALEQYTYEPFGNTTATGSSANPTQYVGRENDGTGLYFYRNRYYSPTYQAFISEDPIGMAGGVNLRSYVGNNPVSFRDPFGFDRSTCQAFYCSPNFWLNAGLLGLSIACPECLAFDFAMEAADGFEAAEAAEEAASAARGVMSDFGGIFESETNAAGGEVWTSTGGVSQADVGNIVNSAMYDEGPINILTGVDGFADGTMAANPSFYEEDLGMFGNLPNVNVYNLPEMTPDEISSILSGPGTTIGAFCNSGVCLAPF